MHSIPDEVYNKSTRKKIKNSEKEALAKIFVDLARQNPDLATDIIATYIMEEKKLVESGQQRLGVFLGTVSSKLHNLV